MTSAHAGRLLRFGITGVGSTVLHTLVALGLINGLGTTPPWANGIAFCMAAAFSYLVNTLWSFSAPLHGQNLRRFLMVSAFGFLLAMGLAWVAELVGWPPIGGIALVVCMVPAVSFVLHSLWTYR